MPQPRVNRIRQLAILALTLACAPASNKRTGSESTSVTRAETAAVATRTPTDSNITRADLARIQGSSSAPVWVIEVSDFQCPFCKQWHDQSFATIEADYIRTGKVKFAYVNFPLAQHRNARAAAEAAMCASAQDAFFPMHEALFTSQPQWEQLPSPAAYFDSVATQKVKDIAAWR